MACQNRKRIWIILIISGVLLIAVGILAGRLIVRSIKTKVDERNCVTSKDDESYKDWVKPLTLQSSVYFWHIKNKQGVLYNRETPQLEERGPYVYKTTSEKIDVEFDSQGRVSYKTFTKQAFDAEATKEKCPDCNENDNITVLNLAYLGLMHQFKGDSTFSLFMIPHLVQEYINQLDQQLGSRSASLSYLGTVPTNTTSPIAYPVFGQWIHSNPLGAIVVDARRGGKNYNTSEMAGLYNVLVNASLVLPPPTFNTSTADYTAKGNGLLSYLGYYVHVKTDAQTVTNTTNKTMMEHQAEQVRIRIDELLCPDSSNCFKVNDTETAQALLGFISIHIPACVMGSLDSNNYGIIATRTQKDLALGYLMEKLKLPPNFPNGVPVNGALINHKNVVDSRASAKKTSMYTCSAEKAELANTWAEYDNQTEIPANFYPNAPSSQSKISGSYGTQFSTVPKLEPCTDTYPARRNHYYLFFPPIYLRVKITYEKTIALHGISLHHYVLEEGNLKQNNYSVFTDGIIDLSNVQGFRVSSSLAGFLYGNSKLYQQLGLKNPTFNKYGTFADIEPITGKPLNMKYRLQVNSVITKDVISAPRLRPLNISFYDIDDKKLTKHFPIIWTEQGGTLTPSGAKLIKDQLMKMIRIACSVTMVLPILGGILLVLVILIAIILKKKSQDSTSVSSVQND